ncbi:expressed unknown protein [Seminavis robusta]|uniref:Uncharacterized protein n=1 Tax=Seminavis robusta TaxID=568900 RepID=A0A9N8HEQ8_9STRA|nr:expressed unknown protein [Seminavis robusta]|eukprot:Sro396_g134220.1 n/a (848) ;mRNA; f:7628-10171
MEPSQQGQEGFWADFNQGGTDTQQQQTEERSNSFESASEEQNGDHSEHEENAKQKPNWQDTNKSKLQNILSSRRKSIHQKDDDEEEEELPVLPKPSRIRKSRSTGDGDQAAPVARPGALRRAKSRPSLSPPSMSLHREKSRRSSLSPRRTDTPRRNSSLSPRARRKVNRERSPVLFEATWRREKPRPSAEKPRQTSNGEKPRQAGEKPRRRSVGPDEDRVRRRSVGPNDAKPRRRSVGPDDAKPRRRSVGAERRGGDEKAKRRDRSLGPGEDNNKSRRRERSPMHEDKSRRRRDRSPAAAGDERTKPRRNNRDTSRSPATKGRNTRSPKRSSVSGGKGRSPIRRAKSMDENQAFFDKLDVTRSAKSTDQHLAKPRQNRSSISQDNNSTLHASFSGVVDASCSPSERRHGRLTNSPNKRPQSAKCKNSLNKGTSLRRLMAEGQKSKPKLQDLDDDDDVSIDDTISWVRTTPVKRTTKEKPMPSPRIAKLTRRTSSGTPPPGRRDHLRKALSEKHVSKSMRKTRSVDATTYNSKSFKVTSKGQRMKELGHPVDDNHEMSLTELMPLKQPKSTHSSLNQNASHQGNNSRTRLAVATLADSFNGSSKMLGQQSTKKPFSLDDSNLSLEDVLPPSALHQNQSSVDDHCNEDENDNEGDKRNVGTKEEIGGSTILGSGKSKSDLDESQEGKHKARKHKRKDESLRGSAGSSEHPHRRRGRDGTMRASTGTTPPKDDNHHHRNRSHDESLRASTGTSHNDRRSRSPKQRSTKDLRVGSTGSSHQDDRRHKSSRDLRASTGSSDHHEDRKPSSKSCRDLIASTGSSHEHRSRSPKIGKASNVRSSSTGSSGDKPS